MSRVRLPSAFPSVAIAATIALIIVAQSAFTFSAVLESHHLAQLMSERDTVAAEMATLETVLYRERPRDRAAYADFRARIARLIAKVPPERAAQLRRIDAEAAAPKPRYAALSTHVSWIVREFTRRTQELNAEALRRETVLNKAATGVLIAGLILAGAMLVLLEYYRGRAERALAKRVQSLQAALRTDVLTELPNERALHEEIAKIEPDSHVALLLVDVDDFRAVNEARGRDFGDTLVETLAASLTHARNNASLFRVYGDRFALLWTASRSSDHRAAAENAWRAGVKALGGITVSAGYCQASMQELEGQLLESAELALRDAKRKGGNAFAALRDLEDGVFVLSRAKANGVRRILLDGTMPMLFQPIVDTKTGRTLAYEALARPGREYDLHGPEEMFDVAERLYKHYELDEICVRSALRSVEKRPDSLIFLNVVPASLESERLDIDRCVSEMASAGCLPEHVVLELTERKIGNINALTRRMEDLRARGFRLALDDTGAGYAGLVVLSKVAFDFVKIDRSLIVRAMDDERARGVLSGVLAIAQETGSTVIAEGIENTEMFAFAREFHARSVKVSIAAMQGYLFGRPQTFA